MTNASRARAAIDLPRLPQPWLRAARSDFRSLGDAIVDRIQAEIPEYGEESTVNAWAEVQRNVHDALRMFLRALEDGGRLSPRYGESFRRLGRVEAEAGRSHDTLQTAYRIASDQVMHQLLDWERRFRAPKGVMAKLSSAIFAFIDHLAALSAEGYASVAESARERAGLLALLLDQGVVAALPLARRVGWEPPVECVIAHPILDVGTDEARLSALGRELFGASVLAGVHLGRPMLLTGAGAVDVDALRAVVDGWPEDLTVVVAPPVPLSEAAGAARLVRRATDTLRPAPGDGVVLAEDHLIGVVIGDEAVSGALVRRRLGPLLELSPAKRLKLGRLLSAWLEFGSVHGSAPGVLDKHRQTLRYQIAQLEAMFGPELGDRDARLEIMIALRAAIPRWEYDAENAMTRPTRAVAGHRPGLIGAPRTKPPTRVGPPTQIPAP